MIVKILNDLKQRIEEKLDVCEDINILQVYYYFVILMQKNEAYPHFFNQNSSQLIARSNEWG